MSGHSSIGVISTVTGTGSPEPLDVLKAEEDSLQTSAIIEDSSLNNPKSTVRFSKEQPTSEPTLPQCSCNIQQETVVVPKPQKPELDSEKLLAERENQLREEFSKQMEKEISLLKERFDFILQNEQVRSSYMLREAYRERQEKISALQTQLECKNLAGLIYVLCSERRKAKLEKLQLIQDNTNYINYLQDILTDGQELILNLSRGYKTAARVNYEWKEKMKKVINEFQNFVYHFAGGSPESNQYFFDLPNLLQINTPTTDNLEEDPCDEPEKLPSQEAVEEEKPWYERLDGNGRPFIMYGDMSEFTPDVRRETLKTVKANKTAPRRWKEYVFNGMVLRSACLNADVIKDEYWKHLSTKEKWECHAPQLHDKESKDYNAEQMSHRTPAQSIDVRGNMGSILKIMTSSGLGQQATKSNLLGARDSMEIASTTKLREKHKHSDHSKVVIRVKNRRTSFFDEPRELEEYEEEHDFPEMAEIEAKQTTSKMDDDESMNMTSLGGNHTDSLEIVTNHVPEQDHKINYEKVCPMKECNRRKQDSFLRSLPTYMKSNPFTHFEQSFDQYEVCSPEQLAILTKSIEEKKKRERGEEKPVDPLAEWTPSVEGVAVQTSEFSYLSLPPCTCRDPDVSPVSSTGKVFKLIDLIPVKQNVEQIAKDCLFDDLIEFDRFKVLGLDRSSRDLTDPNLEFSKARLQQIKKILKQHPSLCELFQANSQP